MMENGTEETQGSGPAKEDWKVAVMDTAGILAAVAAVVILVETLLMPVLQIYGNSMMPALREGDFVIAMKYVPPSRGDVVAFYCDGKILVKRIVGLPGEQIDIDITGQVSIDGTLLEEPYLTETARGKCDIELPYMVPEGELFVMGDNRGISVDSRDLTVGCVTEEQLIGKLIFRVRSPGR